MQISNKLVIFVTYKQILNTDEMENKLEKIASDIRFNLVTDKQISDQIAEVYALGYKAGKTDQKKITNRIKFRYNVLLDWYASQLSQLSMFTKRFEYKQILDGIEDQADQYRFENGLNSCYKPKTFSYELNGEQVTVDAKKDLSYLLVDVMANFIKAEEEKQLLEKQRLELKKQNNEQ